MNKNIIIAFLLIVTYLSAVFFSYTGIGLRTQDDPASIREQSLNERQVSGGGIRSGK